MWEHFEQESELWHRQKLPCCGSASAVGWFTQYPAAKSPALSAFSSAGSGPALRRLSNQKALGGGKRRQPGLKCQHLYEVSL